MLRRLLLCTALGISLSAGLIAAGGLSDAAAADTRSYGAATCRIEKPLAWKAGRVTWIGKCKSGYAHGLGVLRNTVQDLPDDLFLGRVERGYLRRGVLVTETGYAAGRWKAGAIAKGGADDQANRNVVLAAFEDAAKAADATSRSMRRQSEASRFYAELANRLRSQMD